MNEADEPAGAAEEARQRWRRLDRIFTEAAQLEPSARSAFLDTACADDSTLRQEVESLLGAHGDAGHFLEESVASEVRRFSELGPGTRLGAYEVMFLVGEGGMGTVYRALRADRSYRKEVAIKVLRSRFDGPGVLQRFLRERQILASLEHPNIARLLDAATSDDGRPCIVMEYVEGLPIDDYCERGGLSTDERLELFRTVCRAVQAAHQNLIVHRDLKPGNILVTADGVPKLLDFGIAKLLDPIDPIGPIGPIESVEGGGATLTTFQPMTPEYASPEQVRGEAITTASDVYSLGVLLYRLLTGHPPYRLDTTRPSRVERVICEQEPPRPSHLASATTAEGRLARRLRGDLDTIVLKALSKEPRLRYGSAAELADDLRRHQQGLPILARAPTLGYRLGKFLRRHRLAVALVALVVFSLLAGLLATGWQAHVARGERSRAEAERAEAVAERARAEEVSTFLEELFASPDPHVSGAAIPSARDLLDRGAERLGSEGLGEPLVRARLLSTVGQSYRGLGLYDEAEPHLRQALELRLGAHGGDHPEVAESLDHLASLLVARADFAAAEPLLRRALELRRRHLGPEHPVLAESLNNLGQTLQATGDPEAAEPLLREALAMKRRLLGGDHPSVANGLNNLAGLLTARGEHTEAEQLFRQALELRLGSSGEEHATVAESWNNLGLVLYRQQRFGESEEALRRSLELRRQLFGDEHPVVARTLGNLAAVLLKRQDFAAAEPMLRQALASKERRLGPGHPNLVPTLNSLGAALEARQRVGEAEAVYRRALDLQRAVLPAGEQRLAGAALALGRLLLEAGRVVEAEPLLEEALVIRRRLPAGDWRLAEAEETLKALAHTPGRPDS